MSTIPPIPSPKSPVSARRSGVVFETLDRVPAAGERIGIYGPGGSGKTTLSVTAPGPVAVIDLDESLPRLRRSLMSCPYKLDIRQVGGISDWMSLRHALNGPGWDEVRTIVIDSVTRAEELAVAHTLATVPVSNERNAPPAKSAESYGYGKGYQYIYETFLPLLGDLDQHARMGRNIILIAHDCTAPVPNPRGEDWIRYEPRLQSPASGKASLRLRLKEWLDHLLFFGFDLNVVKGHRGDGPGKGESKGSRAIFPCERPHAMAKSRSLPEVEIPLGLFDRTLWESLFGKPQRENLDL